MSPMALEEPLSRRAPIDFTAIPSPPSSNRFESHVALQSISTSGPIVHIFRIDSIRLEANVASHRAHLSNPIGSVRGRHAPSASATKYALWAG